MNVPLVVYCFFTPPVKFHFHNQDKAQTHKHTHVCNITNTFYSKMPEVIKRQKFQPLSHVSNSFIRPVYVTASDTSQGVI